MSPCWLYLETLTIFEAGHLHVERLALVVNLEMMWYRRS